MSQFFVGQNSGGPGGELKSLTGNDAVTVFGDGAGNINLIGANGITVTGNPGTFTETISLTNPQTIGTATTVGNASANISGGGFSIPSNSVMSIRAAIAGYDTVANAGTGGELIGLVRNVGGGPATVVGVDITKNNNTVVFDATWTLVVSGTTAFVQVTGTAANGNVDTMQWRAVIDTVTAP